MIFSAIARFKSSVIKDCAGYWSLLHILHVFMLCNSVAHMLVNWELAHCGSSLCVTLAKWRILLWLHKFLKITCNMCMCVYCAAGDCQCSTMGVIQVCSKWWRTRWPHVETSSSRCVCPALHSYHPFVIGCTVQCSSCAHIPIHLGAKVLCANLRILHEVHTVGVTYVYARVFVMHVYPCCHGNLVCITYGCSCNDIHPCMYSMV